MPVFKLITQSTRSTGGYEVTRWTVNDSVDKVTWERLTERIQRLLKTRSTGFYLSWFDGLDYCTVRDYLELQDAAQTMMAEGDGSIRLYVSRDKREPSIVFGEKPCIEERPTIKPTPIPNDQNEEKRKEKPKADKKDMQTKNSDNSDSSSSDSETEDTVFVPAPEVKPKPEPKEKPQPEEKPAVQEKPKSEEKPETTTETSAEAVPMPIPAPDPQPVQQYPHTTPVAPSQVPMFVPTPNGMPFVQPMPYPNYAPYYVATPTPPVVSYGVAPWPCAVPQPVPPAQPAAASPEQQKPDSSECAQQQKQYADAMTEFNAKEDQRMLVTLKRLSTTPETKYDPLGKQKYKNLSLQALRAMGFRQDESYLKLLIKKTNGDINKIIDVLEAKTLFSKRAV